MTRQEFIEERNQRLAAPKGTVTAMPSKEFCEQFQEQLPDNDLVKGHEVMDIVSRSEEAATKQFLKKNKNYSK